MQLPDLDVKVFVHVYPTESEEKIEQILRETFPGIELERKGEYIVGRAGKEAIEHLIEMWKRESILGRAAVVLRKYKKGNTIRFPLAREPLTVKRTSFGDEGEFGPVWVEVIGDVDALIDYVKSLFDAGI